MSNREIFLCDTTGHGLCLSEKELRSLAVMFNHLLYILIDLEECPEDKFVKGRFYANLPTPVRVSDIHNFQKLYHVPEPDDTALRQICSAAKLNTNLTIWQRLTALYDWKNSELAKALITLFDESCIEGARTMQRHLNLDWFKILGWRTFTRKLQFKFIRSHIRGRTPSETTRDFTVADQEQANMAMDLVA